MRIPASTYRLQLSAEFGFQDAAALIPYLAGMGISDVYLSPIFAPRKGSPHGYDVIDPATLNPALGSREDFDELAASAREHDMGILVDIVPNHMAASTQNPWWSDVLTHGRKSAYAEYFDINWRPPWAAGHGKLLLPVLGDHYDDVLARGELECVRQPDGSCAVRYFDQTFPLRPAMAWSIDDERLAEINADADQLDALLSSQNYQLRFWRTERDELNYRRFFNISDLVCLRMEAQEVREATHSLLDELWATRAITGLRIDHIDGLREPGDYLAWLGERFRGPAGSKPYVLVEKILSPDEALPGDWSVAGTTGYDFLNKLNGVFVDPDGHRALDSVYSEFTGREQPFREVVYRKKRFVIDWLFQAELDQLTAELAKLAARDRTGRDLTQRQLARALAEVSAGLTVYRTYTTGAPVSERARARVEEAISRAREFGPELDQHAYDFLERVLLLQVGDARSTMAAEFVKSWQQFTSPLMAKGLEDTSLYVYNHLISLNTVGGEPDEGDVSFGEFHDFNARRARDWPGTMNATSTHDSKRGEDVRLRLDVLSEMPDEWQARLGRWAEWNEPKKMHPQVAEPPGSNEEMLLYQTLLGSWPLEKSERDDYLERLRQYLIKSAREAKEKTSWHASDERHEYALVRFAERLLDDNPGNEFRRDFTEFAEQIAFFGALNSLSQVVLKTASPGVPDFYQGSERWNLTLVDPDNRRPVDFERRRAALQEMLGVPDEHLHAFAVSLLRDWQDARIKQFVTWRALRFRRRYPALFIHGSYEPLYAPNKARPYVCAFLRSHEDHHAIAIAPRRLSRLVDPFEMPTGSVWSNTCVSLPDDLPKTWTNTLTGQRVEVTDDPECGFALDEVFSSLPVALLYA